MRPVVFGNDPDQAARYRGLLHGGNDLQRLQAFPAGHNGSGIAPHDVAEVLNLQP